MSNTLNKSRQTGFTLVELVIVILILGILSAVALPRFINLGVDARKAKAEGIYGAVRSANQIVRAGALIRSATGATGTVAVDGANVDVVYGYPAASATGIVAAAGLNASDDKVTVAVVAGTPPSVTITVDGAATPANCRITYTEATAALAPVIALSATAC
jgi:MSHA pilin protein MshA